MKTIKFWFFIMLVSSISCTEEDENELNTQAVKSVLDAGMPGYAIQDMEIDHNNHCYFVTWKSDNTVEHTETSFPLRYYLSRKTTEKGKFEILDSNFVHIDQMVFDNNNNLWAINYHGLFLRKNNACDTIIKLNSDSGEGIFNCIAVDRDNNVWAGGLQTGLYKVDKYLHISKYTTANSNLTSNSMTSIHIDESNNKWIALWSQAGVLKITGNNWMVYNMSNSNITYQNIWCLVTDKVKNLWIGAGWDDENESLMRFDGTTWETKMPQNDKNEILKGTVRQLISDKNRIYVVIESHEKPYLHQLLTFDGVTWNKIYGLSDTNFITDLKIDTYRHAVWISIANEGIYKLNL
jgi:ligand-binding sensor domain-containing protein